MRNEFGRMLIFVLGLFGAALCYGHSHHWGRNVVIINPPISGYYYNDYNLYNSYNAYSPYYSNYYYPQYRCVQVPQCYPSGSCNYQTQQCGYY